MISINQIFKKHNFFFKRAALIICLLTSLASFGMEATTPIQLNQIYPVSNNAIANRANVFIYQVRNTQPNKITFNIHSLSPVLSIDRQLSTCGTFLPAYDSCRLVVSLSAPNNTGLTKVFLQTTVGQQTLKQTLNFNIIAQSPINKKLATLNWQATSGPYGGQMMDVAISPIQANTLYAAVYGAGIYESNNNGNTWTSITNDLADHYVKEIVANQNVLYTVTYSDGIYKSTDQGAHWIAINNGLPTNSIGNIFAKNLLVTNNILYVVDAAYGGVYKSVDQGAHWTSTGNFPQGVGSESLLVEGNVMYVGTQSGGIYKSTDAGQTWTAINNGLGQSDINALIDVNGSLYAGSPNYNNSRNSIYKSTDGGQTWLPFGLGTIGVSSFAAQGNTLYVSAFYIYNGQGSGGGIYETTDGGYTWLKISNSLPYRFVNRVVTNGSVVFAGTAGGLYETNNNGTNWNAINDGINGNWITSLFATPEAIYAGTTSGGIFKSADAGANWTEIDGGTDINNSSKISAITMDENSTLYAVSIGVGVYKSDNDGATWSKLALPTFSGIPFFATTILALDSTHLYIGGYGIGGTIACLSADSGTSWQPIGGSGVAIQLIRSMAGNNKMIYVGGDYLFALPIDGSGSWKEIDQNLPSPITFNKVATVYGGHALAPLFALTDAGFYQTFDNGNSWKLLNGNVNALDLLISVDNTTYFMLGSNSTTYISYDKGQTWETFINFGLPSGVNLSMLTTDGNFIYAGGISGLYRTPAFNERKKPT